jgi:hypothetical protein
MITLNLEKNKPLNQDSYDNLLSNTPFNMLECPVCKHKSLHIHGYYKRKMKTADKMEEIRLCRVICVNCGSTHALIPDSIVPYEHVLLRTQIIVLMKMRAHEKVSDILKVVDDVDESDIRRMIERYRKHWEQRLLSASIILEDTKKFIQDCFSSFSRQFMQIKITPNILFSKTT